MKYTKEFLETLVKESSSFKEVMKKCGVNWYSSQNHIRNLIDKYELNTSHFKNKKWVGRKNEELFTINSDVNRSVIKQRIIKENLIEYICQNCNCNDQWMGKTMPLILDHINGVGDDNRLENLRFLCSNCDSIQDTYKNKNGNSELKETKRINNVEKIERIEKNKIEREIKKEILIKHIENSNINFGEMGWGVKLGKLLKKEPAGCLTWVKRNMPYFYEEKCWKKAIDKDKFKRQGELYKIKRLEKEQLKINNINKIKNSGINFKERGCFVKANKILGFKETSDAIKWIKRNIPEVLESKV